MRCEDVKTQSTPSAANAHSLLRANELLLRRVDLEGVGCDYQGANETRLPPSLPPRHLESPGEGVELYPKVVVIVPEAVNARGLPVGGGGSAVASDAASLAGDHLRRLQASESTEQPNLWRALAGGV